MNAGEGLVLRLFVTGSSLRSERALRSVREVCSRLDGDYELMVVDVVEQPAVAESYRVLATPTLIREFPGPVKWIIGDLADRSTLAAVLDIPWVAG